MQYCTPPRRRCSSSTGDQLRATAGRARRRQGPTDEDRPSEAGEPLLRRRKVRFRRFQLPLWITTDGRSPSEDVANDLRDAGATVRHVARPSTQDTALVEGAERVALQVTPTALEVLAYRVVDTPGGAVGDHELVARFPSRQRDLGAIRETIARMLAG